MFMQRLLLDSVRYRYLWTQVTRLYWILLCIHDGKGQWSGQILLEFSTYSCVSRNLIISIHFSEYKKISKVQIDFKTYQFWNSSNEYWNSSNEYWNLIKFNLKYFKLFIFQNMRILYFIYRNLNSDICNTLIESFLNDKRFFKKFSFVKTCYQTTVCFSVSKESAPHVACTED